MTPAATLCLFAKPPEPGRVKTRLARVLGHEAAAELAAAFLGDAWAGHDAFCTARGLALVLATTASMPEGLLEPAPLPDEVWLQGEGDLGRRIERILQRALAVDLQAAPRVAIAVGADSPGLPPHLVDEALALMARPGVDAVLGPADDGGFYLLALRRCPDGLLAELPWSSPETFARTLARLEARGLSTAVLEAWFDVDEPLDLERLQRAIELGEVSAPRTRALLATLELERDGEPEREVAWVRAERSAEEADASAPGVGLSVVLPVLEEASRIETQLAALVAQDGLDELLVVDGGSRDDTVARARRFAERHPGRVRVLESAAGRARQMNRGAAAARGHTLLFLHADVRLPPQARRIVDETLARPRTVAGAFRTWTVDDTGEGRLGPLLHLADLRSRYTRLPYGDQALFLRRSTFERVGGFPELPLMEDLELALRLRRLGRIHIARARVEVSGRRFIARPVFYTALVNVYPLLYRLGVPASALARLYRAVR